MPDLPAPPVVRELTGWGRTAPTAATVVRVLEPSTALDAVKSASDRGVIARGLGRAYGDAAQNAGGTVLDLTGLARVHSLDAVHGVIDVDAGLSLDALMRLLVPLGWFVAVTPGTRYVTVGGAIASDIHGKNHHIDGTFCQQVDAFDLLTADGEVRTLTPSDPAFWVTAGGMGLTGVVLRARLRLIPVQTSRMRVDTERVPDVDELMNRMRDGDAAYRYSVAWIDLLARGRAMGRSVLTRGDHARPDELTPTQRRAPLAYDPHPRLRAPALVPGGLLNRLSVAAFNELWFRKAPRRHTGLETIPAFFHPLDGVLDWNRVYGPGGFVQYQFVVPDAAADTVREAVRRLSEARCPSFLAVLKRFGPGNDGPLSFPQAGWTLALDVPARVPGLAALCDDLDELVATAGGRVYLSKDARVRPQVLRAMYPRLEEWRAARAALDPQGVFMSDLGRRLELV